jgi:MoxR-like ATPase
MGIRDIIKAALFTPNENGWGLPLSFYGGPGCGKTFVLREIARECGLLCEVLSPGERGEGAVGCVPMPRAMSAEERATFDLPKTAQDAVLSYPLPEWAVPFFREGRGVVLCDELTTTPPALQPALLGLLLDKRLGGNALPRGVRMLGAYNPPETAANGYALPKPVANRMAHIAWEIGASEAHADWMLSTITTTDALQDVSSQGDVSQATIDPAVEEARVLRVWPAAAARAVASYASFIRKFPALLHQEPEPHKPEASGAWASRRTWSWTVRAVAAAAVHELSDTDRDTLICGFLGDGVGGQFIDHLQHEELPDAVAILEGRAKFAHNPAREDITLAVLDACCAYTVPKNAERREKRAAAFWQLLDDLIEGRCTAKHAGTGMTGAKDLVFPAAQRLAKAGLLKVPESRPVLRALNEVMEAAGIQVQG